MNRSTNCWTKNDR